MMAIMVASADEAQKFEARIKRRDNIRNVGFAIGALLAAGLLCIGLGL